MYSTITKLPNGQNLIDKFSMYIKVEKNNGRLTTQWKYEFHLKRNLDLYKSRHEKFASLFTQQDNGRGLVKFWIDIAFNHLLQKEEWEPINRVQKAWEHLKLYCEESCYRATEQVLKDVWKEDKYECWEEYFFVARCLIYQENKFRQILAKYDSIISSLDTYMTGVLLKTIKDEVGVGKFSKWRLLCKKSDKELKEALERDGNYEPKISRLLFARKYFKQVYQINKAQNPVKRIGQKWLEPDSTDFAEAAKYYNAEKFLPSAPHEVSVGANITAEELKAWMGSCITALQNYPKSITPRFSLEALQEAGHEFYSEELDLPDSIEVEDSNDNQISLVNQTEVTLQQQLLSLKPDQQEILLLYYRLGLNQKEIADKFEVTQGAIAHRLRTIERKLVNIVYRLKQPSEWITQYVDQWLARNYQAPIYSDLIHATLVVAENKLDNQEREVLQLCYGQKLDAEKIASQLGIPHPQVTEILQKTQAKLEAALIKEIDTFIKKFLQILLSNKYKNNNINPSC